MGVVAQIAERVAIIYAGKVMEVDDVIPLYRQPRHPYTWALLDTLPRLDRRRGSRLRQIPGGLPDLASEEIGEHCAYLDRCPKALTQCRTDSEPELKEVIGGRIRQRVACYNRCSRSELRSQRRAPARSATRSSTATSSGKPLRRVGS